jgi:hypothetical protein
MYILLSLPGNGSVKEFTAATNEHATAEELLDAFVLYGTCRIK